MRTQKWVPLAEPHNPGLRRVLEGMRRLNTELECLEDDDLPLTQSRETPSSKDGPILQ
jgi:hypothetical protein